MSTLDDIRLLDWTARQLAPGERGATAADAPDVLERLGITTAQWTESQQGALFAA